MNKTFLNPKGHQNPINGSKVTVILLKGCISPVGGASAVEGLRSTGLPRLVFIVSATPVPPLIGILVYGRKLPLLRTFTSKLLTSKIPSKYTATHICLSLYSSVVYTRGNEYYFFYVEKETLSLSWSTPGTYSNN